jgi:hypothetical protein
MLDALARATEGGAAATAGTIDADLVMPPTRVANLSCAAVIEECAKRVIDAATWFDYGASSAQLQCRRYTALGEVTLALTGSMQVELADLHENRLPGAKIVLRRQTPRKVVGDNLVIATFDDPITKFTTDFVTVTAGDVSADVGRFLAAVELSDDFGIAEAQAAVDFMVAASNNVRHQGSLRVVGDSCNFALRPGLRMNVTGGLTEWASMGALIQEVEHDLGARTTSVRCGAPTHLGFSDLEEWLRWWKTRGVSRQDKAERNTADSSSENFTFGAGETVKKGGISSLTVNNVGATGQAVIINVTDAGGGNFILNQRLIEGIAPLATLVNAAVGHGEIELSLVGFAATELNSCPPITVLAATP